MQAVSLQFPSIPITVYSVVDEGAAVTVDAVVELSPVEGDQVYVEAPFALKEVVFPLQILELVALTVTFVCETVMVTNDVSTHVPVDPDTVYVVVLDGDAVTVAVLVELNPVDGLQV